MGAVLMMASEKAAFTLTDRGTFLSMRDRLRLQFVLEGDPLLHNQYTVMVVRDAANAQGARTFADWLTSPEAQQIIGDYGHATFGKPLFTPNAE